MTSYRVWTGSYGSMRNNEHFRGENYLTKCRKLSPVVVGCRIGAAWSRWGMSWTETRMGKGWEK